VEGVYFLLEDWGGRWLGYGLNLAIGEYYILAYLLGEVWLGLNNWFGLNAYKYHLVYVWMGFGYRILQRDLE